jgi:hypothetical protein
VILTRKSVAGFHPQNDTIASRATPNTFGITPMPLVP